jgi:DNA-binding LacI/PurR family transcriptional regulator
VASRSNGTEKTRTGLIGVAGKGFEFQEYSAYWVNLLCGIRTACNDAEKQILLLDHRSNKNWEKADGVLVCDWSNQYTMQWLPPGMPCVSVVVPAPGVCSVYADDYAGGRQATAHLLELGHRRIAHIHSGDAFVSGRRLAGYRDALREEGIQAPAAWERTLGRGEYDYGARFTDRAREGMQQWLQTDWNELGCTAVIAQNDETALGIIEALQEAGFSVPEDVSVVGYDGAPGGEWAAHRITTIAVPLEEIGRTAAQLLLRQLEGEAVGAAHRVFPTTLRQGYSTQKSTVEFDRTSEAV